MAETLTVRVEGAASVNVDVRGVTLFTDAGLTTPATFPADITADTSWYAAEPAAGARHFTVTVTLPDGTVTMPNISFQSLPLTIDALEGRASGVDGTATGGGSEPSGALLPATVVSHIHTEVGSSPPSGPATVDGYTVVTGDRVFLTGQGDAVDNGMWVANTDGDWTRPTDWASGSTVVDGLIIPVGYTAGSNLWSSIWMPQGSAVVDTDQIHFDCLAAAAASYATPPGDTGVPRLTLRGPVINSGALPTSDPAVNGQLWNNAGVVTVSAG